MPLKTVIARLALVVTLALGTTATLAAPCAGFTDVDTSDPFCPNVEWLKNRGVTTGCTLSTYCPGEGVSRLAMAAFMNRLGTALTPVQLLAGESPGAIDLDVGFVACATAAFPVTGFPRRAFVDGQVSVTAPAGLHLAADPVYSVDGGANWLPLTAGANNLYADANRWAGASQLAQRDLLVGESVRFGIRVHRAGWSGTQDLSDSRCSLRVLVFSRDGVASPY